MKRCTVRMLLFFCLVIAAHAQDKTVIFLEDGFPSVDSSSPSQRILYAVLPNAVFVDASLLPQALSADTRFLVLPYGSAFPEEAWPSIYAYLQRGGNLLVLGGKPFTRATFRENGRWKLRDSSVRFSRQLLINDYVGIQTGAYQAENNSETALALPQIPITQAFSPIIRLSHKDVYPTEGSAGSLDAHLDALQWLDHGKDHIAASAIAIDHLNPPFEHGRWVFLTADVAGGFENSLDERKFIARLAAYAARGAEHFTLRSRKALFTPGESIDFQLTAKAQRLSSDARVEIAVAADNSLSPRIAYSFSASRASVTIPSPQRRGLYRVEASFVDGNRLVRIDHSAFWVRDDEALHSGPRLATSADFFKLDGKPTAILGTTHMASDVQRLFLMQPNVEVWDRDMQQIKASGLNLLRTGLWSGWRDVTNDDGTATELFLRNLEAYLLTARRHDLQVQFTFFSFLPESFGGVNPYLDPVSVERQKNFIRSVAQRFKDVPYLSYDLINEPSISQFTWRTRPNGDKVELAAWNAWLHRRYNDWPALAEAWNVPALGNTAPLPTAEEFAPRGAYFGNNGLKVHDYYLFAQEMFADWTRKMVATIRESGSVQLVTVGQDDGGYQERLNPAFFADSIDFTTNHTWWLNDDLLWCSLIAKQPGKPMLIQETGLQRQLTPREEMRLSPEGEAALLERKMALSFAGGAGAVEWLWNVNPYMTSDNEVTIGAVRADGTLKPDAQVLRNFARFAEDAGPSLSPIEHPQVAIVTSQALQYSPWNSLANIAQQRAVRAMFDHARLSAYIVAENQLSELGHPKLVVLPSAQALTDAAWHSLMQYVRDGGHLLITGPVDRDEHWHAVHRASEVGVKGDVIPLASREAHVKIGDKTLSFQFNEAAQENLETFTFSGDSQMLQTKVGKGNITWVAYPIELNDDLAAIGKIYSYAAQQAGVTPMVDPQSAPSGVLIYAQPMKDAVLYIFESESDAATPIAVQDPATHANLRFTLGAQHAALALVRRADGMIVARYGF